MVFNLRGLSDGQNRRVPAGIGEHARELNRGNLEDATSEAIDVAYVALGTVLTLGYAGRDACYSIAGKNDAKTLTTHGSRGSTGKVVAR